MHFPTFDYILTWFLFLRGFEYEDRTDVENYVAWNGMLSLINGIKDSNFGTYTIVCRYKIGDSKRECMFSNGFLAVLDMLCSGDVHLPRIKFFVREAVCRVAYQLWWWWHIKDRNTFISWATVRLSVSFVYCTAWTLTI